MAGAERSARRGLGRGLSTLIAELGTVGQEISLPIEKLHSDALQPRRDFPDQGMNELVASIRTHGVLQPLIVRPVEGGDYKIVAGERRWRAAQVAKLHELPVVVRQLEDDTALEISIIENIQRESLNPIEEADAYHRLMETFGHTQQKLSESLGKSRSHIANMLRLRRLGEDIKELLRQGQLSMGHARALVVADDPSVLAKRVVAENLSVRRTEELAAAPTHSRAKKKRRQKDADTKELEQRISASLDTRVSIEVNEQGAGRLIVGFSSIDRLDRVVTKLLVREDLPAGKA